MTRDDPRIVRRAALHAALGDPTRLAIVEELAASDRSPSELARTLDVPPNLLAHHLTTLQKVDLVERTTSAADGRRRYVRLRVENLADLAVGVACPDGPVVFVCTHNSARSQLAAALWRRSVGGQVESAGTDPAPQVHPGAVAAAARRGLDISRVRPKRYEPAMNSDATVITVCDHAHEELEPDGSWLHWSVPDPVGIGTDEAFDDAIDRIEHRIATVTPGGRREERNDV